MNELKLLDVVAITEDIPSENLCKGQVGTIVEDLAPGVYCVEFCDDEGQTYALASLRAEQCLKLHYDPVVKSA